MKLQLNLFRYWSDVNMMRQCLYRFDLCLHICKTDGWRTRRRGTVLPRRSKRIFLPLQWCMNHGSITTESSLQLYMWCCSFWMPLLIPTLVVVNDEKSPRIHEKGSDIASAAMPSWATCQYHKYSTVPERIITKLTMSICLLINFWLCSRSGKQSQRGS